MDPPAPPCMYHAVVMLAKIQYKVRRVSFNLDGCKDLVNTLLWLEPCERAWFLSYASCERRRRVRCLKTSAVSTCASCTTRLRLAAFPFVPTP